MGSCHLRICSSSLIARLRLSVWVGRTGQGHMGGRSAHKRFVFFHISPAMRALIFIFGLGFSAVPFPRRFLWGRILSAASCRKVVKIHDEFVARVRDYFGWNEGGSEGHRNVRAFDCTEDVHGSNATYYAGVYLSTRDGRSPLRLLLPRDPFLHESTLSHHAVHLLPCRRHFSNKHATSAFKVGWLYRQPQLLNRQLVLSLLSWL